MKIPAKITKVFEITRSMDKAQTAIERLTANNSNVSRLKLWYDLWLASEVLGRKLNTAPQVRGRAAEMMLYYICEEVKLKMKGEVVKGYHSFHFGGTEQDYILATPYVWFFIESKASKTNSTQKMLQVARDATEQNTMHMEIFSRWVETVHRGADASLIVAPCVVLTYDKSKVNNIRHDDIHNNHKIVHITDLTRYIAERVSKGVANERRIFEHNILVSKLNDVYNSKEHTKRIKEKKERHGYV